MTREDAHDHHTQYGAAGGNNGRCAHLQNLLEREFQTEGKEEEDHADVAPEVNALQVGDAGHIWHIGRGDEACYDVAQHQWLLQALEKQCHGTGTDEDEREVRYQGFKF